MENKKYTLFEFLGALESDDFDKPEISYIEDFKKFFPKYLEQQIHDGDCTKQPITCLLCCMETLLADYKEYYFNEEEWRKINV
jgi:hypothetical protein